MNDYTLIELLVQLSRGAVWTIALSLTAFAGGGVVGVAVMMLRLSRKRSVTWIARCYVELFQGTPLLIQLFMVFFGLPFLGIEPPAFVSAAVALTLYSGAYLGEIWRGCVQAIPAGQWEASRSLALNHREQMLHVICPQAARIALGPTVGFLVQIVKATSLTAIIGFIELSRSGMNLSNATFQPFLIYGLVGAIYFVLCAPLSRYSSYLENRFDSVRSR